jgi:hypothetical protein
VFAAVYLKITVFWNMTPCSLVDKYESFTLLSCIRGGSSLSVCKIAWHHILDCRMYFVFTNKLEREYLFSQYMAVSLRPQNTCRIYFEYVSPSVLIIVFPKFLNKYVWIFELVEGWLIRRNLCSESDLGLYQFCKNVMAWFVESTRYLLSTLKENWSSKRQKFRLYVI